MKKKYWIILESTTDGWTGLREINATTWREAREIVEVDALYNVINIIEGGKLVW